MARNFEDSKSEWVRVLDADEIRRAVTRIAHEIVERNRGARDLAVVGVRTRGEFLAERVVLEIEKIEGVKALQGVVDITLYRDDIGHSPEQPIVRGTDLPFNVDKVTIILVDDVLYTGRTVRAALDAIIDFGRPHGVQLAVLVDRGHRELPIRADYVGKSIPTARTEQVEVSLCESEGVDAVYVRPLGLPRSEMNNAR
jgi:pyrimidine operon attenuation protein/uracil phosphoribosyltransferase